VSESFPLWAFENARHTLITRGRTQEEAAAVLAHNLRRAGSEDTFRGVGWVPADGARLYGTNHAPGWLHRPPYCIEHVELDRPQEGRKGTQERFGGSKTPQDTQDAPESRLGCATGGRG
jgi:hypothetical protein